MASVTAGAITGIWRVGRGTARTRRASLADARTGHLANLRNVI